MGFGDHTTAATSARRAFTLTDLVSLLSCASVLAAVAAAGMSGSRTSARQQYCSSRMATIGQGSARFALANQDLFAGFTWEVRGDNSHYPDLNAQQNGTVLEAHSAQAVDIMRRGGHPEIPPITSWTPHPLYWSLTLAQFENRPRTDPFNICPSDEIRTKWRRHPRAFYAGAFLPLQPQPSSSNKRWPHSSSYTITGGAMDPNQSIDTSMAIAARMMTYSVGPHYNNLQHPTGYRAGPSAMSVVAFPSQKVHVHDVEQRHSAVRTYHGMPTAAQPVLFFDGSVSQRVSGEARPTWTPEFPKLPLSTTYDYAPRAWEAPTVSGGVERVTDRYRWTRDGLRGWDYGL